MDSCSSRAGAYAELHCISNYSFLRGASHPEELVARAAELGYAALAITDECSLAGVVRAHQEAKRHDLKLITGTEIRLADGPCLVLLARNRRGYAQLCRLITRGRRRADKGQYELYRADVEQGLEDCLALLLPRWPQEVWAGWFRDCFGERGWLALGLLREGRDEALLEQARRLSECHALPLVAVGHVLMHRRRRRVLRDLLTAIRHGCSIDALGWRALVNGERHLRSRDDLAMLYPGECMEQTLKIAECCNFSLDELAYEYPDDVTPPGSSAQEYLRRLVREGMRRRWPEACPEKVARQIEHELELIAELDYAAYFLTVWDIVAFARQRGILCQGRGSAANSAVCYCLGITEVDPARMNLLFERFISRERGEPPDIDVDFEHERREEVIQYIYEKYGRQRAALAATVISYRPRSALRDAGKALGLSAGQLEQLAQAASGWRSYREVRGEWLREAGFDPDSPRMKMLLWLVNELQGFPRHLSQHVGGFVISRSGLDELVPVENAAMPERTIIQWDKDDLEALGLLKVDVLALGMLSAIRRSLVMLDRELQDIPAEDPEVYEMICRADTVGVFQIESRAQMSMLPRLRPRNFYDLVIEVAIMRPGPIQGDMVHPYLRRRQGQEPVDYPSEEVRAVLERTLGVPIFQEQVIRLTQVAAGFSPGEADQIRRSMAAWKRRGGMDVWERKLMDGMRKRGYPEAYAKRIFRQIQGFGDYGFPESHAASFALLVYVSAWIKCHHPAVFACALLNSQPMGFYAPAQLVRDAREHGVEVLPADVQYSNWNCHLESGALRLGLRMIKGLSRSGAERLVAGRGKDGFSDVEQLAARANIGSADLKALAAADALASLESDRHRANWAVAGVEARRPLLESAPVHEKKPDLPIPDEAFQVLADYRHLGLSLRRHPLALLRPELGRLRFLPAEEVGRRPSGLMVRTAGLVLNRQRPGKGNALFITLEDETGVLNLIVWKHLAERQRQVLLKARLLGVWAEIQRAEAVQHLIVRRLYDYNHLLGELPLHSRDFR